MQYHAHISFSNSKHRVSLCGRETVVVEGKLKGDGEKVEQLYSYISSQKGGKL